MKGKSGELVSPIVWRNRPWVRPVSARRSTVQLRCLLPKTNHNNAIFPDLSLLPYIPTSLPISHIPNLPHGGLCRLGIPVNFCPPCSKPSWAGAGPIPEARPAPALKADAEPIPPNPHIAANHHGVTTVTVAWMNRLTPRRPRAADAVPPVSPAILSHRPT